VVVTITPGTRTPNTEVLITEFSGDLANSTERGSPARDSASPPVVHDDATEGGEQRADLLGPLEGE
jgi:hypothetical protein